MENNKTITFLFLLIIFGGFNKGYSQEILGKEYWQSLSDTEKVSFITGVYASFTESLNIMGKEAERQKKRDPYWISPFSLKKSAEDIKEYYFSQATNEYGMITKLLDIFYINPDNEQIPLMFALHVIALQQSGEVQRANELLLLKQKEYLSGK